MNDSHDFRPQYDPWLSSIQDATNYSFCGNSSSTKFNSGERVTTLSRWTHARLERIERSLQYLDKLKIELENQNNQESAPLASKPPSFWTESEMASRRKATANGKRLDSRNEQTKENTLVKSHSSPKQLCSEDPKGPSSGTIWIDDNNRFASIALESESDSDDENEIFLPDTSSESDSRTESLPMDACRLLIRLATAQSDLYAKKARLFASCRRWLLGASALQSSIVALAQGLELADASISKTFASTSNYNTPSTKSSIIRRKKLETDAYIVSLSSNYLAMEKSKYLNDAHKQAAKLESILKAHWRGRDRAKKRIGEKKWRENQKEKSEHAKRGQKHEIEYHALEEALKQLEDAREDTYWLIDEVTKLREKLRDIRFAQNRRNGRQVLSDSVSPGRTSLSLQYGWTLTGSLRGKDCVEFYEKRIMTSCSFVVNELTRVGTPFPRTPEECICHNSIDRELSILVLLDVYFNTGSVRITMEYDANDEAMKHFDWWKQPRFFDAKLVNPELYHWILMDPLKVFFDHK